jgi:hypothetical protein
MWILKEKEPVLVPGSFFLDPCSAAARIYIITPARVNCITSAWIGDIPAAGIRLTILTVLVFSFFRCLVHKDTSLLPGI